MPVATKTIEWDVDPLDRSEWSATSRSGKASVYLDFDAETQPGTVYLIAAVDSEDPNFTENLFERVVPAEEAPAIARFVVEMATEWFADNDISHWSGKRNLKAFVSAVEKEVQRPVSNNDR